MTQQQSHLTSAFVLHTRPYRETSALADFFTKEFGRLTAVVRGVRSASNKGTKSRARTTKAGLLLPFLPLCVSFRGKTELLNTITLEATGRYYLLQQQALFCGLYANELLYRLLQRHDPYPTLYTHYQDFLCGLQNSLANAISQRWQFYLFAKRLLQEIGYGVEWGKSAAGKPIDESLQYCFEFGVGFSEVGCQQEIVRPHKLKINGKRLLALHNSSFIDKSTDLNESEIDEIGRIFDTIFYRLLGDKIILCQQTFAGRR